MTEDNKAKAENGEGSEPSENEISTPPTKHTNINANANANANINNDTGNASPIPDLEPRSTLMRSISMPIPLTSTSTSAEPMQKNTLSRSTSDRGVFNGQGIDAHPYPRGSVIEVMYGAIPKKSNKEKIENDENDDENDDDEEDLEDEERNTTVEENYHIAKPEIRLADIIDRAASKTPDHAIPCRRWKYYIHYREYNRRMDEWITDPTRIISPPSVGNAKVRAIKKEKQEEERRLREREKREREQALVLNEIQGKRRKGLNDVNDGQNSPLGRPVSQRASSRRASAKIAAASSQTSTSSVATEGNQSLQKESAMDEQERLRLTRSQRRKRGGGNDANEDDQKTTENVSGNVVATLLPETELIKDKVVTVAAQELDEHEGLDEASLREHEEVTKVKNIDTVELGRYRMVRDKTSLAPF